MTTTANQTTAERILAALEPYDLREEGSGRYRANSPLRPGSNSHGFSLTIDGAEHGAFYDHVSGERGTLYDLADRLGIERSSGAAPSSKRRYDSLADYCGAAYVEAFKAAGWSDVQQAQGRPALAYQTRTGTRYRFTDGEKPTYKPAKAGQGACWYGLERAIKLTNDEHPLVLVNGASSVVTAQAHGVPAIALEGSGESNIASHLRKGLLSELCQYYPAGGITVALDCDDAGHKAARAVVPLLREAGYEVTARDLGGADGFDMRDFCRLHEDGSPAALARCKPLPRDDQAGAEPQRPRFTLETLDDLAQLPPTTWLVHERIPADSLTLLYGASESGKSFIALHWALTIALRNPERAVVYVAPEGGSGYQRRAAAWLEHWKKPVPKNLLFIRSAPRLGDTADLNELINAIVPYQPIFTVLDTLARCAVELDENSAKDMGIFIEACDKIRRATGSAVMPVHHSGKDARSGARGSSALRAAVDMAHEVVRDDELVTLSCDKSKDIAKPDPIYLHMVDVAESVVLLPSDKVISTSSKLTARERAVLAALNLEVFQTSGAKSRQIFEVTQVPEGTAYGILSKLKRLGLLSQDAKGDPYRITEAGKKQLSDYERTVNSGASWAPDDDDDPDDDPPTGGDNGGHSSHSSGHSDPAPTMNEYGSVMPNYGTMKGFSEEKPIVDPEMPENGDSNYESDTASQCPTMTTMKHYEATMNSDDPSLLWEGGYIYDSPHSESEREEQAGESPVTDDNQEPPPAPSASGAAAPPDAAQGAAPAADGAAPDPAPAEPAHDAALIAACGPMTDDTRAKIAQARQNWRSSEAAFSQLCRVLGWDVADAIRAWVEAEKLARAAQARGEQQREVRHE